MDVLFLWRFREEEGRKDFSLGWMRLAAGWKVG